MKKWGGSGRPSRPASDGPVDTELSALHIWKAPSSGYSGAVVLYSRPSYAFPIFAV